MIALRPLPTRPRSLLLKSSLLVALVALVALLLARPARAAEAPASAPASAPPAPAARAAPEPRDDAAWSDYHQAFRSLLTGDRTGGVTALERVETAFPGHPAAAQASSLLRIVRVPEEPEEVAGVQRPSRGARAELVIFQTVHGVVAGAELCVVLDCQGTRAHALALMGGGGAGLALSLFGSSGGVTPGQVELLDTGTLWGAWNGLAFALIAGQDGNEAHLWRTMMIGQGSGLLLGGLLWYPLHPTSGQVALSSTFGVWGTVGTLLGIATAGANPSQAELWTALLVAGDASLVVGAVVGRDSTISRGRTLLIDAGGVLGVLLGALIASGMDNEQAVGIAGLAGTALGLGVAGFATRNWDVPATNLRLAVVPTPGGGAVAGLGGTF